MEIMDSTFQGSGLAAMVAQMTYGKREWECHDDAMRRLIPIVNEAAEDMIKMIDADTDAFNDYMVIIIHMVPTYRIIFHTFVHLAL